MRWFQFCLPNLIIKKKKDEITVLHFSCTQGVHIDMDEIEIEDNDILNQAAEDLVSNRELVPVVDLELNEESGNSGHKNSAE